jgi:PleD family two-component response regulator
MPFLGVSGMQYSGASLAGSRILLVEDSNLFTSMIRARLRELLDIDVEICRNFEELQLAYDKSSEPIQLAISNMNLPGAEKGEALAYLLDLSIPTIAFTGTFLEGTRDELIAKNVVDYILKDNIFAVDLLAESICRFLTNQRHHVLIVDDSPTARALLSSRLKRYNFRVSIAEGGVKALEILKANRDIGVSSSTNRLLSARFLKAGGNDFILRPFIDEEFYCRVNQNLDTLLQIQSARRVSEIA